MKKFVLKLDIPDGKALKTLMNIPFTGLLLGEAIQPCLLMLVRIYRNERNWKNSHHFPDVLTGDNEDVNDSPIEQVRLTVPITDNPSQPALTFRTWVQGMATCIILSFVNTFSGFKTNYSAKVSDFGASRFVPLDQIEIATMVQGTLGYLDPQYMQTQQLTQKSDVYSFGVVLTKLLTGEKPISFERNEQERSLPMYFLSCLKEDRIFEVLQVDILNDDNREEMKKVAILAAKCMRLRGEDRPNMKEVAMELESIKHTWIDSQPSLEDIQYLLQDVSFGNYETGDCSNPTYSGNYCLRDDLISLNNGR